MTLSVSTSIRTITRNKVTKNYIVHIVRSGRLTVYTESTGQLIELVNWDKANCRIKKNYPNYEVINARIRQRFLEIDTVLNKLLIQNSKPTLQNIKNAIINKSEKITFFEYSKKVFDVKYCTKKSEGTKRKNYSIANKINRFDANITLDGIDTNWISKLKKHCEITLGNSNNTIQNMMKTLSLVFNFAIKENDYSSNNPVRIAGIGSYIQPLRAYLTLTEIKAIFTVIVNYKPDDVIKKTGIYFLFSTQTGIRIGDLKLLNIEQHIIDDRLIMQTNKQGININLKLTDIAKKCVEYMRLHPYNVKPREFNLSLKVIGAMANIETPITAHMARHTLGATLAQNKIDIPVAQKILGHKSRKSTEIYYHLHSSQVDDAMDIINRL
jgi:integrase